MPLHYLGTRLQSTENCATKKINTSHLLDYQQVMHNLAHILQEMVQDFARDAARIITGVSLQDLARIGARLCNKRDISRACAKQVLHARFLHNLA